MSGRPSPLTSNTDTPRGASLVGRVCQSWKREFERLKIWMEAVLVGAGWPMGDEDPKFETTASVWPSWYRSATMRPREWSPAGTKLTESRDAAFELSGKNKPDATIAPRMPIL